MIRSASKGFASLIYENDIDASMPGTHVSDRRVGVGGDYKVYVSREYMMLRWIDKVMDGVSQIDYAGFVDLAEEHKTASW